MSWFALERTFDLVPENFLAFDKVVSEQYSTDTHFLFASRYSFGIHASGVKAFYNR